MRDFLAHGFVLVLTLVVLFVNGCCGVLFVSVKDTSKDASKTVTQSFNLGGSNEKDNGGENE